jgi:2-C-methyl-D-erythritol 4-phosphate cytidylyltransferase/2-C-methyl-D-erythritol 2,4-cyclodiphosphate synthase
MNDVPRIGLGIDVHRLAAGRPCMLAGVRFEGAAVGPVGHSDGDAVLHAACDAVLGAAGLDDLGSLFSDRDPANAGRASAEFCAATMRLVRERRLRVLSMDVVVETEAPKLQPHRAAMRARLGELFELPADRVNVKGKTGEKVDAIGRGEALRATVVVLLGSA